MVECRLPRCSVSQNSFELPVVEPSEQQQGADAAEQGEQHVGLGIPDVALGAEECFGGFSAELCDPPFDQFVEGTDREANAAHEEGEPFAALQRRAPQQDLARRNRRHESLHEMPNLVVVVALETTE